MKNKFHREVSTKNIQKLRMSESLTKAYIDKIAKHFIRRNSLLYFKLANLTEEQIQRFHRHALFHQEASKVDQYDLLNKKKKDQFYKMQNSNKCECCKIVQGQKLSIFISYEKFSSLGMGVLLFFYFCQIIIALSSLYFLIFSLSSLIMNARGLQNVEAEKSVSSFYTRGIYQMFSIQKNQLNQNVLFLQSIIGLIWCIVFVIIQRICRNIGQKKQKKFDQQIFTPSDLTIKIQNLPVGNYTKEELAKFLEQKMCIPDFHVKKIFISYEISQFNTIINDLEYKSVQIFQLKKSIRKEQNQEVKKNKNFELMQKYKYFYDQLHKLKKQISHLLEDQVYRRNLASGCCLVRVNDQTMKNLFLEKYQTDMIGSLERYRHNIASYCGFSQQRQYLKFKGNQLQIMRAPEPLDIIWSNCRHQKTSQNKIGIWIISIVIICADFTVLLMIMLLQYTIQRYNANINSFQMVIIQISMSLATILLNNILYYTINFMIYLQNNHSRTEEIISKTQKLIISQLLNTILLPIIAMQMIVDDFEIIPSVSSIVLSYSIVNAVVQNILTIFSREYVLKTIALNIKCIRSLIIRYYAASQIQINKNYIQRLNKFYQNEDIDMSNAYSFYISTFLHMSFFGFQEPIIILFGLLGISINCIIKKILFTERYTTPLMIDSLLFNQMMKFLAVAPLFYGIGGLYCLSSFKSELEGIEHHNFQTLMKPKIVLLFCILIGLFNTLKLKLFETKIEVEQVIANHMISGGELDTGIQFDLYDDYHVNYDLKNIFGYIEYMMEEKPTDSTLQRINAHVTLNEKIHSNFLFKKRVIQPPRKLKSENYTTTNLRVQDFRQHEVEHHPKPRELYNSTVSKKTNQRQIIQQEQQQEQRETIKTTKVMIQKKVIVHPPSINEIIQNKVDSEEDQDIQTQRKLA